MSLIINRTFSLNGKVSPPSSKSHSIRALILASICNGQSVLKNVLHADDTNSAVRVSQELGAQLQQADDIITVNSRGLPLQLTTTTLNSGNSGITTHFILPVLGLRSDPNTPITLNCLPQMQNRPISPLIKSLNDLGMKIEYLETPNRLPVSISGALVGGNTDVDGTTSQYLSALLIALPCAPKDSIISVKNLQERPYVAMTLKYLTDQDIKYHHHYKNKTDIYEIMGRQQYRNFSTTIPNDFSSASYIIAAAVLIDGETLIENIDMNDPQGDKALVHILKVMGADIEIKNNTLHIRGGKALTGIKIDAKDIPDLLPTLAVIGTYALGKTEIENIEHARIKETDRIHSMATGLKALGAKIEEHQDKIIVYQSKLTGGAVAGHDDHRTIMALTIAGMIANGTTIIDNHQAINKTFPQFIHIMQSLGAKITTGAVNV